MLLSLIKTESIRPSLATTFFPSTSPTPHHHFTHKVFSCCPLAPSSSLPTHSSISLNFASLLKQKQTAQHFSFSQIYPHGSQSCRQQGLCLQEVLPSGAPSLQGDDQGGHSRCMFSPSIIHYFFIFFKLRICLIFFFLPCVAQGSQWKQVRYLPTNSLRCAPLGRAQHP